MVTVLSTHKTARFSSPWFTSVTSMKALLIQLCLASQRLTSPMAINKSWRWAVRFCLRQMRKKRCTARLKQTAGIIKYLTNMSSHMMLTRYHTLTWSISCQMVTPIIKCVSWPINCSSKWIARGTTFHNAIWPYWLPSPANKICKITS